MYERETVLHNPRARTTGTTVVPRTPVLGEGPSPRGGAPPCTWSKFPAVSSSLEPPHHTVGLLADLHGQSWHFACTPLPKNLCIGDQHSVAARAGCQQEPETQLGRGGTGLMPPSIAEQDQGGGQGLAQVSKPPSTEESPPRRLPRALSPPSRSLRQLYKLIACLANIDFSPCSPLLPVW